MLVSKDTSLVSIEAHDDSASGEPNVSNNRDEGAKKTPVAATSPPVNSGSNRLSNCPEN